MGYVGESSGSDQTESLVDHVLVSGSAQPSQTAMSMSATEFGDQEPSTRFEHPVHLFDCSLLIILSYVVQDEGARDRVEGGIRERKVLCEGDLEACRQSTFAGSAGRQVDHLGSGINPVHRAARRHPCGKHHGKAPGAAAHIENPITDSELKIVSEHPAESASASPAQAGSHVVQPRPVNRLVAAGVMGMAVNHWQSPVLAMETT